MADLTAILPSAGGNIAVVIAVRRQYVIIDYRGFPADLLAVGAIEPVMTEKGHRGKPQYDSYGDRYMRKMFASGKLGVERRITDLTRARALPAIPPDVTDECIEWLEKHPGKIRTDRALTTCGSGYWVKDCGTEGALIAAGLVKSVKNCCRLLNGYYEFLRWEEVRRVQRVGSHAATQPSTRLKIGERKTHLRLVWTNPTDA